MTQRLFQASEFGREKSISPMGGLAAVQQGREGFWTARAVQAAHWKAEPAGASTNSAVIPGKRRPGIHNHRISWLRKGRHSELSDNHRLWLWIPDRRALVARWSGMTAELWA